jgi:putative DNA primase/helicase
VDDAFDFSPLSDLERKTAAQEVALDVEPTAGNAAAVVLPVLCDAPHPPVSHHRFGTPTATWTYANADRALLFYVARFDAPGEPKQFLPLSLWRSAKGLTWRWKAVPAPRPIYGLDQLAGRPDAPVLISEGEKSCEAARFIFDDHVVVTSPGGSGAADKADWTPLAGRKVTIWPDNDEPGAKYAAAVASILTSLGCEVALLTSLRCSR